jgi:hypothetical protein
MNKDINEKCKLYIFRIYLKIMLLYGAETWTTTKRENNKIQTTEIIFFREILNKTKDRIRNNIRSELYEIK